MQKLDYTAANRHSVAAMYSSNISDGEIRAQRLQRTVEELAAWTFECADQVLIDTDSFDEADEFRVDIIERISADMSPEHDPRVSRLP